MAELATYSEGSQSNNYTFSEIERMAGAIVKSGLFGVKICEKEIWLKACRVEKEGTYCSRECMVSAFMEGRFWMM